MTSPNVPRLLESLQTHLREVARFCASILSFHHADDLNDSTATHLGHLFTEALREEIRLRRPGKGNGLEDETPNLNHRGQVHNSCRTTTSEQETIHIAPVIATPTLTQGLVDVSAVYDDHGGNFQSSTPTSRPITQEADSSYNPGYIGTIIRWNPVKGYGFTRPTWPKGIDPHKVAKHRDYNLYFNQYDIHYKSKPVTLGDVVEFYSYRSKKSWCGYKVWVVYFTTNDQYAWTTSSNSDQPDMWSQPSNWGHHNAYYQKYSHISCSLQEYPLSYFPGMKE